MNIIRAGEARNITENAIKAKEEYVIQLYESEGFRFIDNRIVEASRNGDFYCFVFLCRISDTLANNPLPNSVKEALCSRGYAVETYTAADLRMEPQQDCIDMGITSLDTGLVLGINWRKD